MAFHAIYMVWEESPSITHHMGLTPSSLNFQLSTQIRHQVSLLLLTDNNHPLVLRRQKHP